MKCSVISCEMRMTQFFKNTNLLLSFVFVLLGTNLAKGQQKHVLHLTGGTAKEWQYEAFEPGDHLIYSFLQWYDARLYYYKGLTGHGERFQRYLKPQKCFVESVNLDEYLNQAKHLPQFDFKTVDLVILDDVYADAGLIYVEALEEYVKNGGKLLIVAGSHMLGGHQPVKDINPSFGAELVFDPPKKDPDDPTKSDPDWAKKDINEFSTDTTYHNSPLDAVLPVEVISWPDLVVEGRKHMGGGRAYPVSGSDRISNDLLSGWTLIGYHKVKARENSETLATINGDPLLVSGTYGSGQCWVFTGSELEAPVRLNGDASGSSLVTPNLPEVLPWKHSEYFWRMVVREMLGEWQVKLALETSAEVAQPDTLKLSAKVDTGSGGRVRLTFSLVDQDGVEWWRDESRGVKETAETIMNTSAVPVGHYAAVVKVYSGDTLVGETHRDITIKANSALSLSFGRTEFYAVPGTGEVKVPLKVIWDSPDADLRVWLAIGPHQTSLPVAWSTLAVDAIGQARFSLTSALEPGRYRLVASLLQRGLTKSTVSANYWISPRQGPPDLFMMNIGSVPTSAAMNKIMEKGISYSYESTKDFLQWAGRWPGIAQTFTHDEEKLPEGCSLIEDSKGNKLGEVSWNDPRARDAQAENIKDDVQQFRKSPNFQYYFLDDEPGYPSDACYSELSRQYFKQRYKIDAVKPEATFTAEYLDKWSLWEEFRCRTFAGYYRKMVSTAKEIHREVQVGLLIDAMGPDYARAFEPSITHAPFDIQVQHIYATNAPLLMIPLCLERAHSAQRAIGHDKPIWNLYQNWGDQSRVPHVPSAEYLREQFWLGVSHGADVIGYSPFAYGWWIAPGTDAWEEIGEQRRIMHKFGSMFRKLKPKRKPIGLLYSSSQGAVDHLKSLVTTTTHSPVETWHNWYGMEDAYYSLKASGIPFEVVTEEELIAGELEATALVLPRIQYLRPQAREALKKFINGGGAIYKDHAATIEIEGAQMLEVNFDRVFNLIFPADPAQWNARKHRNYYKPLIDEAVPHLLTALEPYHISPVITHQTDVVWQILKGGEVEYLFVVNGRSEAPNLENFEHLLREERQPPSRWLEVETELKVRTRRELALVYPPGKLYSRRDGGYESIGLSIGPADAFVIAMLPERVSRLHLTVPKKADAGSALPFTVQINGRRHIIKGVFPIQVQIEGTTVTNYTATADGMAVGEIILPHTLHPGSYIISVKELATGVTARANVKVESGRRMVN